MWLAGWVEHDADPRDEMDSLPGVLRHLSDAWARRDEPNVVLVHYDDLSADLDGEMRRIAARLGIDVAEDRWPELVEAATFDSMRARADDLVPDATGVLKDRARFFRGGVSGAGREVLDRRPDRPVPRAGRASSRRPTCSPGCTATGADQTGVCWWTASRQSPPARTCSRTTPRSGALSVAVAR